MRHDNLLAFPDRRFALAVITLAVIGAAFFLFVTNATAAEQTPAAVQSVVSDRDIQGAMDAGIAQAAADRQVIQVMLQRDDIRQAAGSAGLDLERAGAAVDVLSGSSLEMLAAQARAVDAGGLTGGDGQVVVTTTGIIIILLILILLVD